MMANLVKRYVLVDADSYSRGKETTNNARLPNPFANPDVEEAKRLRQNMHNVSKNPTLDVEDANAELQTLMNRYLDRYANAKGKKAPSNASRESLLWNELRKQQKRDDKLLRFNTPETNAARPEDLERKTPEQRLSRGTLLWNALSEEQKTPGPDDNEEDWTVPPRTVVKNNRERTPKRVSRWNALSKHRQTPGPDDGEN